MVTFARVLKAMWDTFFKTLENCDDVVTNSFQCLKDIFQYLKHLQDVGKHGNHGKCS